jgi:CubicO group peptidase (beta-lactamase class C family)
MESTNRRTDLAKGVMCAVVIAVLLSFGGHAQSLINDPQVASALEVAEAWVESQAAFEGIPGISIGVVHDQDLLWARGFGFAHLDRRVPAAADTIYSICSISKLFTGISVMQLRDQERLRLHAPVQNYLPWFSIKQSYQDSAPIALAGILTHSSGLPRESDFPYWTAAEGYPFPSRAQIIERLAEQETLYPADTYSQYSNLGWTLAGEVVSAVSGQPYDTYVEENVLKPLGLQDTTPELPEAHKNNRLATGYTAQRRDGTRTPVPFYVVRGMAPAYGFASTVEDLARFASWQFRLLERGGTEVIAATTLREMHRVHWMDPGSESTHGWAFNVSRRNGKTFVGHGGNCPGYRSQLLMSPSDKVAVIFLTNGQGTNTGRYARAVFDLVTPALTRKREASPRASQADPEELRRYVGRYEPPFGGEIQVFIKDGDLALVSLRVDDPAKSITTLKQTAEKVFRVVREHGEGLGEKVEFELGPDGRAFRFKQHSNYSYRLDD